ncbi:MAG: hypothetical protein ACYSUN_16520, partial [Planctomycetota bacterium]
MTSSDHAPHTPEASDPEAGAEVDRLVALLHSLPDPDTPDGIVRHVMAEVRRREARPRVLQVAFRIASQPGAATALAAGLACLAVFVGVRGAAPRQSPALPKLEPSVARPIGPADARPASPGQSPAPLFADPVALFVDDLPHSEIP